MNIIEAILSLGNMNDDDVIFAKKENGRFTHTSEVIIVSLLQDEVDLNTIEIANKYCFGFDYFLEIFIIKDFLTDISTNIEFDSLTKQVDRIIYYAEFDA